MPSLKWRMVLGVLVGGLLPVPLMLVLAAVLSGGGQGHAAHTSPVLSKEERLQRVTYHRTCRKSTECEPPLGCLTYEWLSEYICTDSKCLTDAQCREGESCQFINTEGDGPRIGVCVIQGVRREGEECEDIPSRHSDACAPGLRCVQGWCGRPCSMDAPESCPQGFFCADDGTGPVCLPTCEARGCPDGQQCVRFPNRRIPGTVTACRRVYGTHCQQTHCPEGEQCIVNHLPARPGEMWMVCMQPCGKDRAACPEGLVCVQPYCRKPCEPQQSGACGVGMRCKQTSPDEPAYCRPDFTPPGETED